MKRFVITLAHESACQFRNWENRYSLTPGLGKGLDEVVSFLPRVKAKHVLNLRRPFER